MFKNKSDFKKDLKDSDYNEDAYNPRSISTSRLTNRKRIKKKNEYTDELKHSKWQ